MSKRDRKEQVQILKFEAQEQRRDNGRILVSSGNRSRNVDYWTGKPYRLLPAGMRTEHWEKNPLVFYMHNFFVPLGTGSEMYLENGQLWIPDDFKFHRLKVPVFTAFGTGDFDTGVIADLWDEGVLNAVSIHVMMTPEDLENIIETDEEILIPTSEVIEVSVVTVPGDRDAKREEYEAELLETMVRKGVDREMAECVACNAVSTYIPQMAVLKSDHAVNKDSEIELETPEVSMSKTQVEKTEIEVEVEVDVEAADTELVAQEETVFEQEFEVSVLELAEGIVQDEQALSTVANALVEMPEFVQAIAEAIEEQVSPVLGKLEATISSPHRIKMVLMGSGQRAEEQEEQTAQPVERSNVIQQAAAAPVALPQSNGTQPRRKPKALDLVRPVQ